jgi:hypothetical protein
MYINIWTVVGLITKLQARILAIGGFHTHESNAKAGDVKGRYTEIK